MKYMVFDLETENHERHKRFASPFVKDNWVVMRGWKIQGDKENSCTHHPKPCQTFLRIPDDITILVGHNIKFDLLYEWENPELKAFFKRGGRIWDTMYAEYLIEAMHPDSHMCPLDAIAEKYGGRKKIDGVKALWEAGYLTSQIDPDMLKDYLIGTKEEKRNSGDIGNTELAFLGQMKKAKELKMIPMILARMDGLCATTEMEFNGLKIDLVEAKRRMRLLEAKLYKCEEALKEYIPEMSPEIEFNWASRVHVSCLIFGGTIRYQKKANYIDDKTGELARYKATEDWPLFDGEPMQPGANCRYDPVHMVWFKYVNDTYQSQDTFTSGVKKGSPKFKKVTVEGELKEKYQDFYIELPGYTTPDPKWEGAQKDGAGQPLYQTNADVIEVLGKTRDIPFLKLLLERQDCVKDLGTYYLRYDNKKKDYVGMLTCVMPGSHLIHHNLNHVATVTSRLSSNNPNLQNIPRGDTSEVKKMFISRFENGMMMESDYSQLEVVIQGMLSGDKQLCLDLRMKIDFHCKRVAAKMGCTYEEALYRCKNPEFADHLIWKNQRTKCKEFSFQRAYGAGAAAIALSTGMDVDDVKQLIEAEDIMYPGVLIFNQRVEAEVNRTARQFKDFTQEPPKLYRRGYWQAPTGTRYTFRSYDAPDFLQERGVRESFMPTELKNYPVQGTGGEIVQIVLGRLWRHFVKNDNYEGRALLCNTVHDCVWFDVQAEIVEQVAQETKKIMESVPELLFKLYGMKVDVPFPVEVEVGKNLYDKKVLHI